MAYTLPWGTKNPGFLVFLIDLSGSMAKNGKIEKVNKIINLTSEFLIARSTERGELLNRFSLSIIGYNTDTQILFPKSGLYASVIDLDCSLTDAYNKNQPFLKEETKPEWQTFTAKAFHKAAEVVKAWIDKQEKEGVKMIPVPIVIHITDGYPYEGNGTEERARQDALKAADELKSISTPDGNTLLFNFHIDHSDKLQPLAFPVIAPSDPERKFLFEASSTIPEELLKSAQIKFPEIEKGSKVMVSNEADESKLAKIIMWGTVVSSTASQISSVEQAKPTEGDVEQAKP